MRQGEGNSFHRCIAGFNSRTREGCDQSYLESVLATKKFQFTHPGGVRPSPNVTDIHDIRCFNSRTREGCDRSPLLTTTAYDVSIHAPGRGATGDSVIKVVEKDKFQFTHPGGVRRTTWLTLSSSGEWFQFTHPGGVRRLVQSVI